MGAGEKFNIRVISQLMFPVSNDYYINTKFFGMET